MNSNRKSEMLSLRSVYRNEKGFVLPVALMLLAILSVMGSAAAFLTRTDLKITNNYKNITVAFQLAEAGQVYAKDALDQGKDLDGNFIDDKTQVLDNNQPVNWDSTALLASLKAGSSGNLTIARDPVDANLAVITSTAVFGGATKTIEVVVREGGLPGLGAIYLPGLAPDIETKFGGTTWSISGNDTKLDGTPGTGAAVPGIATTDPALTTEITDGDPLNGGLNPTQFPLVTGLGGAPSVRTTSTAYNVQTVINNLLTYPHITVTNPNIDGNRTWGNDVNPKITYINAVAAQIQGGNVTGSGVLILADTLKVTSNSSFTFHGLIIVFNEISFQPNATTDILGMVWVERTPSLQPDKPVEFDPDQGPATFRYSSEALNLVNVNWSAAFSTATKTIAWREVM